MLMIQVSLFNRKEKTEHTEFCDMIRIGNKYIELTKEKKITYWKYNPKKDIIKIIGYKVEDIL